MSVQGNIGRNFWNFNWYDCYTLWSWTVNLENFLKGLILSSQNWGQKLSCQINQNLRWNIQLCFAKVAQSVVFMKHVHCSLTCFATNIKTWKTKLVKSSPPSTSIKMIKLSRNWAIKSFIHYFTFPLEVSKFSLFDFEHKARCLAISFAISTFIGMVTQIN